MFKALCSLLKSVLVLFKLLFWFFLSYCSDLGALFLRFMNAVIPDFFTELRNAINLYYSEL